MGIEDYIIDREKSEDFLRPRLHFTVPHGWINDPNGLIFYKGLYHLFYQYNGDNLDWTDVQMHWGHAVSEDMLHWKDLPIALTPDQPYDYDPNGGGCFSGSAIEWDGIMYLFYTGSIGSGDELKQTQNIAISEDGVHFQKYEGNPVISAPPPFGRPDFRDPRVLRHGDKFYMIIAGSVGETQEDAQACVYMYKSDNLFDWEYVNIVIGPTREYGTMIECPDFFELDDKWVLSVCLMNNSSYKSNVFFVGNMDFDTGTFDIISMQDQDLNGYWYAPQTFKAPDGRRIQMCWQNTCLWMQWFNDWGPTISEGWRSCLSLPHYLSLDENNHIRSKPISIASETVEDMSIAHVSLNQEPYMLNPSSPFCYELCFTIVPEDCFSGIIEVGLAGHGERHSKLTFDIPKRKFMLDIRDRCNVYGNGMVCADIPNTTEIKVRIQMDHSSLEICFNDDTHLVACIYPEENQKDLWIRTPYTNAGVEELTVRSLKR